MTQLAAYASLFRLVARSERHAHLWPRLHEQLLAAAGGQSSVLLQFEGPGGHLRATSGHNIEALPLDPWVPSAAERAGMREATHAGTAAVLAGLSTTAPALGLLLGAPVALIVPLTGAEGVIGLALVGMPSPPILEEIREPAMAVADAFVLAIERVRLQRDADQQRELRDLLDAFSRAATSTLNLHEALAAVCHAIARSLVAASAAAWLHDREARELVFAAGSDPQDGRRGTRIPAADLVAPAAAGLRSERPELTAATDGTRSLAIPLRGRRRAIGTLVLDGLLVEAGTELQVIDRADELGRQLSTAIENVLLLEQVLRSHRDLAQSEKLAALGQFVAGIAHELNNPLQGVLGHLDLLAAAPGLGPALKRDVRQITKEADRAAKIVRSLLLFSGTRRVHARPVRVSAVLGRVASLRSRAMRHAGIVLERCCDPDVPPVAGDALLLQQALLNIVVNAEQALAGPGRIRIDAAPHGPDAVRIVIADTGPGIPEEALPRVFEPFFTTKEVGEGTGLGLAIAYGIVQEHRGTLTVANGAERGAVFTLTLPAHPAAAPRAARRARRADNMHAGTR